MFHYDCRLQVYLYTFMYVYPEKVAKEKYFPDMKDSFSNYKKKATPGPVPKHWHLFSFVHLKYYELDLKFDETEIKSKSDHSSNNRVKLFCQNIVFIEEEWFADINLNYGATSLTALTKRAQSIFNKKQFRDTRLNIPEITIINDWNIQVIHIFHEGSSGKFIFNGNILYRILQLFELSHEWILKNFKYQEISLFDRIFD